jgi:5-methylcytosine-specific restriction enzyme A
MPQRVPTFRPRSYGPATVKRPDARAYNRSPQRRADHLFYCSAPWLRLRALVLSEEPLCWWCLKAGDTTAATTVHHVIERHVRPDLELDRDNLRGSCGPCHSRHHAAKKGKRQDAF